MKRTALLRKQPLSHTETADAKECAYQPCKKLFIPLKMGQKVCGPLCAGRKARADRLTEKAQDREKRNKLKPISKWESECRAIVQKIARIRDKDDGCISCPLPSTWGGQWHGSHYRSVGACSALQFSLWNIHKACSSCNAHKGGNIIEYRPRLVAKVGVERVDWLEAQNKVSHLKGPAYVEYLKRFKAVMGRRLRRMEKRAAN